MRHNFFERIARTLRVTQIAAEVRFKNKYRGRVARPAAKCSVTRLVAEGLATVRPPVWVAQPDLDDNVPAAITEAFVDAYRKAGGHLERVHFPESRHGFAQQASPATDKCVADVLEFVERQGGPTQGA